jgi:pSer/pThr/pTyr-binding forkhead associated (FHA) protein
MARLILSLGGQVLTEVNMTKERYTIGRLPDNDVRIDNPAVSGHQSLIINILNDSFLEDLNSANGTYVNGKLIKKHALQHGDVVTVGHHQLRFVEAMQEEEEQEDEFARTMIIDDASDVIQQIAVEQAAVQQAAVQRAAEQAAVQRAASRGATEAAVAERPAPRIQGATRPTKISKVQVLNGKFSGREIDLSKTLTTLGSAGVQVIAITRRANGYFAVMVENKRESNPPSVNGQSLGSKAVQLAENDVIEIIGIKMGFFTT